jgi:hypothetical protein
LGLKSNNAGLKTTRARGPQRASRQRRQVPRVWECGLSPEARRAETVAARVGAQRRPGIWSRPPRPSFVFFERPNGLRPTSRAASARASQCGSPFPKPTACCRSGFVHCDLGKKNEHGSLASALGRSQCFLTYFSPASILVLRMFCLGGSGQVVNSEKEQGGLYALLKSSVNVSFACGCFSMSRKRDAP